MKLNAKTTNTLENQTKDRIFGVLQSLLRFFRPWISLHLQQWRIFYQVAHGGGATRVCSVRRERVFYSLVSRELKEESEHFRFAPLSMFFNFL